MSKNRMKKFVSILLALTMTVLCFVPAAAAEPKDKVTPILVIAGFGEYVLVDGDVHANRLSTRGAMIAVSTAFRPMPIPAKAPAVSLT